VSFVALEANYDKVIKDLYWLQQKYSAKNRQFRQYMIDGHILTETEKGCIKERHSHSKVTV